MGRGWKNGKGVVLFKESESRVKSSVTSGLHLKRYIHGSQVIHRKVACIKYAWYNL